ncbi:general secretion pathway protein C [Acidovorax sp. SRB_14]|uniref:general secretion pathway protein C n=1 Tax=unclassified Acidovorax TaxID=2684926 RepID=UPI00145F6190|nr:MULTISPECIES: general secretion pathway protein C [unclassified Acidovorax]NMM78210.1 general secretion pathway protein C [Acidovorax sp. SRB_24]NMM80160.1 general secretion pathway protein C [Acidovorax sp. SRB_14]NMM91416.1 general secretion pathway protein C [Rhodococcus sp. SRB_17]
MVTNTEGRWNVRLATMALWALAAASVFYWALRLLAVPSGLPVPAVSAAPPAPDAQAMARLLGVSTAAAPTAPALASRFALVGVLAGRSSGGGAALIAVDGQPAKPFRAGAVVDAGLVLQSLGPRQARLGPALDGPATITLEMPARQ